LRNGDLSPYCAIEAERKERVKNGSRSETLAKTISTTDDLKKNLSSDAKEVVVADSPNAFPASSIKVGATERALMTSDVGDYSEGNTVTIK